ncbi:MAG: DUF1285 domain-containing protein [Pseudobdellovibrionaceae bacterium]
MRPHKIRDYDHAAKKARGIAFTIDRNGEWYAHAAEIGQPGHIGRDSLVKLFAGAGEGIWAGRGLSIDDEGRYWVKTPYVSYEVEVEDLPFVIVDYKDEDGQLVFETQWGEKVALSADHPLRLSPTPDEKEGNLPEIEVRQGLKARLSRAVTHELIDRYGQIDETSGTVSLKLGAQTYALGQIQ